MRSEKREKIKTKRTTNKKERKIWKSPSPFYKIVSDLSFLFLLLIIHSPVNLRPYINQQFLKQYNQKKNKKAEVLKLWGNRQNFRVVQRFFHSGTKCCCLVRLFEFVALLLAGKFLEKFIYFTVVVYSYSDIYCFLII